MKPDTNRRYFKELRFRQLRAFCLAVQSGSFITAADTLGISRPALWNQVRSLETEFGADLVRMEHRRVELTTDGQLLFDLAAPMVEAFDSIKNLFMERRPDAPRTLAIATTTSILNHELRTPLTIFQKSHPRVHLRFVEGPSRECVRKLEADEVELAVFGYLGPEEASPALHLNPMGRYPVVLLHSPTSPLAGISRLDAHVLARYPLILPAPETSARLLLDRFFSQAGVIGRLNVVLEAQNTIQFIDPSTLSMGAIITTCSPFRLAELQKQGKALGLVAREIPGAGFEQIHCASRTGHRLSSSAADFLKLLLHDTESFIRHPPQKFVRSCRRRKTQVPKSEKTPATHNNPR